MKVIDPGHKYYLDVYDTTPDTEWLQKIRFMKRVGDGYPFNTSPAYSGTNCQEILRALIDRVKYLNKQIPSHYNDVILFHLRSALLDFEKRAAKRHGRELSLSSIVNLATIEDIPTCRECGHIECEGKHIDHEHNASSNKNME